MYQWISLPLVVVVGTVLSVAFAVPLRDFYPVGQVAGDKVLSQNDDGSSEPLRMNVPFVFFTYNWSTVYVRVVLTLLQVAYERRFYIDLGVRKGSGVARCMLSVL